MTGVRLIPPWRRFAVVLVALGAFALADALVDDETLLTLLFVLIGLSALVAFGLVEPEPEPVPDARVTRPLKYAQIGAAGVAIVAGGLAPNELYAPIAGATYVLATVLGRLAIGAWARTVV